MVLRAKKAVDPDCAKSTPTAGHKRARYSGNSAQKCTVPFGALGFSQSEVAHTHRSSSAFLTFMAARLGAEIEIQTVSLEQLGWRYVISHSIAHAVPNLLSAGSQLCELLRCWIRSCPRGRRRRRPTKGARRFN